MGLRYLLAAPFWVICRYREETKSSLPGALSHIIGWKRMWARDAKAK